jgi:hypothetical protein
MDINKFVFIILIIQVIAISMILISFRFYNNKFLVNLIPKLPILTGLLTSTGIILTYLLFSNTYTKAINDTTIDMTRNGFRDTQKMLSENYDKCPKFIESLNFEFVRRNYNNNNNNNNHVNDNDNDITIIYISNSIFNTIANYLFTSELTEISDARWMATFLGYFSSETLREKWSYLKYNYGEKTRLLIDYLIEVENENTFENADDVINVATKMISTEKFKDILTYVDRTKVSSTF